MIVAARAATRLMQAKRDVVRLVRCPSTYFITCGGPAQGRAASAALFASSSKRRQRAARPPTVNPQINYVAARWLRSSPVLSPAAATAP